MRNGFMLFLITSFVFSFFSMENYENYKEKDAIEYLLNERILIMNEFLYGDKDMVVLNDKLSNIEADDLLANDLDILEKVMQNPTDFELCESVKIDKITDIKENENISMVASLNWDMRDYDGKGSYINNYSVHCKWLNNKLYLTKLKIIE